MCIIINVSLHVYIYKYIYIYARQFMVALMYKWLSGSMLLSTALVTAPTPCSSCKKGSAPKLQQLFNYFVFSLYHRPHERYGVEYPLVSATTQLSIM